MGKADRGGSRRIRILDKVMRAQVQHDYNDLRQQMMMMQEQVLMADCRAGEAGNHEA